MTDDSLADQVVNLLSSAKWRVVIISAFIRSEALKFLLKEINPEIKVSIYARWRFADITAGASNMEVIDVANEVDAVFKVHNALHAKIYIADDTALLGSANVTNTGLAINKPGNLEVLTKISANLPEIKSVLNRLENESVIPRRFTDQFIHNAKKISISYGEEILDEEDNWLPSSLPKAILEVKDVPDEKISDKIIQDYLALGIVGEITRQHLQEIVTKRRIFSELYDALCNDKYEEITDARIVVFLSENFSISAEEAISKWTTLKEWINEFAQDMYITPSSTSHGDALRRGGRYPKN